MKYLNAPQRPLRPPWFIKLCLSTLLLVLFLNVGKGSGLFFAQKMPDSEQFERAARLIEKGHYAEALPVLEELAGRNLNRAAIFLAMGQCNFELGQYRDAESTLVRAVKLAPNLPQGHYLLGSVLGMLAKGNEAMTELREAIRLAPEFAPAYRVMGMFQVEHQQYLPEGRRALETAIRLDPADSRAHYWLGRYFQGLKEPDSAARWFDAALKLDPNSDQARLGLAQGFYDLGEINKAQGEYEKLLARNPSSYMAILGQARCFYSHREYDAALKLAVALEKKEAASVEQRQLYWLLARIHRALGQTAAALAAENKLREFEQEVEKGLNSFWETGKPE
jgi:tetratricopeptide (TPR) repeat protein